MKDKREAYFDNARWFLIILVVFGHVISPIKNDNQMLFTLYTTIYLFHMAAFILISGYFAKGFREKGYLLKIAKKTLIPYVIFQILYTFFYYGADLIKGKDAVFDFSFTTPHFALWFLLSLFCWNVLLFVFARFGWWTVAIAFAVGIAIGYVDGVDKYLSLSRTFVFFPFFLLGYYLKPAFFKKLTRTRWKVLGGIVLGALLVTFYIYSPAHSTDWLECSYPYSHMGVSDWQGGLTRIIQYALMTLTLFSALSLMPRQHLSMTVRGRRTLYVYLLHGFIIQAIRKFLPDDTYDATSDYILLLILFAVAVAFLLASRYTKKIARPLVELRV